MNNNQFKMKAPFKSLQSNWKDESFKKPSVRGRYSVKKSKLNGKVFVTREEGVVIAKKSFFSGNEY